MIIPWYEAAGDPEAPALVLSSSLGTTTAMWDAVVPALAEHYWVIRYDHRGHGRSPVPAGPYRLDDLGGDVLGLLDHLGLDRVRFAGLSLGGMTGMWLAAHAPERVSSLALLCTSARLGPPETWTDRIATVLSDGTAAIADAALGRWFTPEFRERRPDVAETYRAMLAAQPADGYAACCAAIREMDLTGDLRSITAPTLVISGEEDPVTPPSHGLAIAGRVPGAEMVTVPGASHLAAVERPDEVRAHLLDHFGKD
ncbi:3-oxoadipate enol-lactonase [Spongiactinospora sp. TRM90649]|uniref:3-oxoadipate enol-lactonase n=1 Tax=Spongiactinospora sp. TRM90649 TaxID=3031114 RepID=UPI0023F866D3|nr:3-oxoadipate enol-lactonase [Spongiactinospora sp. TRM90649]MDF5753280.1 3-oxoadipate enol-lactonase [Spongiactinospora sp. TRM90649]